MIPNNNLTIALTLVGFGVILLPALAYWLRRRARLRKGKTLRLEGVRRDR